MITVSDTCAHQVFFAFYSDNLLIFLLFSLIFLAWEYQIKSFLVIPKTKQNYASDEKQQRQVRLKMPRGQF